MRRLALLLLLSAAPAWAQNPPPGGLDVSLLTFGPGEIYWQRFGHNAIVVRDRAAGTAVAYNYGIFDFSEENFLLNFARGRMQYRIAAQPLAEVLWQYRAEGRWIVEQRLALTPGQASRLGDFLEWNARPENARYPYDYFLSNCSTRLRDALDTALGGALRAQTERIATGRTYRGEVARLSAPDVLLMLGMDAGLGPATHRELNLWEASFIPAHLMDGVRAVTVEGAPLVRSEATLYGGTLPDAADAPPNLFLPFLFAGGLGAVGLAFLGTRRGNRAARAGFACLALAITIICGAGGVLLALLWGLTEHWGAWGNPNLLLFNPLALVLLPVWFRAAGAQWRPSRSAAALAAAIAVGAALPLAIRGLPGFEQENLHWILLVLPLHAALAATLLEGVNRRP